MKFALIALALCGSLASALPEIGKPAPNFKLTGSDGKTYQLTDVVKDGKTVVVLEWYNPGCPYVKRHYSSGNMQRLQETFTGSGVKWFTVASGATGKQGHIENVTEAAKLHDSNKMKNTAILLDSDQKVATAYGAKTTPHMFVINKKGLLAYNGAIDSESTTDPLKIADYVNDKKINKWVELAVNAAQNDKMPDKKTTEPYGCSVKY